jgi:hypothetical protein
MNDTQMESRLELRWSPVTDADGRVHLESRWVEVGRPAAPHAHAARSRPAQGRLLGIS